MTAEEMAEEYAKKNAYRYVNSYIACQEAYLAGLKIGKDINAPTKWHDLGKNPNDLPEETEFIESDVLLLLVQLRGTKHKRYELGRYIFSENVFSYTHLKFIEDVIAWKEIIPPKQEE